MNELIKQITENILECRVTTIKQLNKETIFIELEDVLRLLRIFGKPEEEIQSCPAVKWSSKEGQQQTLPKGKVINFAKTIKMFENFCFFHSLEVETKERNSNYRNLPPYYTSIKYGWLKRGSILSGDSGNGSCEKTALIDYIKKISGKLMLVKDKEIEVPNIISYDNEEKKLFDITTRKTNCFQPNFNVKSKPDYSNERPSILLTEEEANKLYYPKPGLREEKIKEAKTRIELRPRRAGQKLKIHLTNWTCPHCKFHWKQITPIDDTRIGCSNCLHVFDIPKGTTREIHKRLIDLFMNTQNNHNQMTDIIYEEFKDKITRNDAMTAVDYFAKHLELPEEGIKNES